MREFISLWADCTIIGWLAGMVWVLLEDYFRRRK